MTQVAGFQEIEHTADWELQAWAPDLTGLLEQAAKGMYSLAGTRLQTMPRLVRQFSLPASDPERLLVTFLSELLWLAEQDGVGFDTFNLRIQANVLHAQVEGAPVASQTKEIKAVTYHQLVVRSSTDGVEANIVFDV